MTTHTYISLNLDLEDDGRLSISSRDLPGLYVSGSHPADFNDLGPELIRLVLAKQTVPFETVLRTKWATHPSEPVK
jgi:hypothetical protein